MECGRIVVALAGLALAVGTAAACASNLGSAPEDVASRVSTADAKIEPDAAVAPLVKSDSVDSIIPSRARDLQDFVQRLAVSAPQGASIGVLPLAYYGDLDSTPTIPQLGVMVADEIAERLGLAGYKGSVAATDEVVTNLRDMNIGQSSLFSPQAVMGEGDRLGFDVIVFGTMRLVTGPPPGQRPIRFEIVAFDVMGRVPVAKKASFELENKGVNREAFRLKDEPSAWTAAEAFEPTKTADLAKELAVAVHSLASRLARHVKKAVEMDPKQSIYVAPADSSAFVGAIARLRAMQDTLWSEYWDRKKRPTKSDEPDPLDLKFVLDDLTFSNFSEARAYVNKYRENLTATQSFSFCQGIASSLSGELRLQMTSPAVLKDFGAVSLSNDQKEMMQGALATGGLVRSQAVREVLQKERIALVIQPIFLRIANQYSLRVEVYNLETGNNEFSSLFRLDGRYGRDLAEELEVRGADGKTPQMLEPRAPKEERQAWDAVYSDVSSGVVRLGQGEAHGSGFVVGSGIVMTNSHVLKGLKSLSAPVALLFDGRSIPILPLTVLADDPFLDVAVLLVEKLPTDLHVFVFAPEEDARVGLDVAVLGHPKYATGQVFSRGYLTSVKEFVDTDGTRKRPSYMYSSPTRAGTSGSPVMLIDGRVVAVNSHGQLGEVTQVKTSEKTGQQSMEVVAAGELTGWALGAPGVEAKRVLDTALPKKN